MAQDTTITNPVSLMWARSICPRSRSLFGKCLKQTTDNSGENQTFGESQLHFIFQWYMVSVVHVYNRWSKSEIRCYVDGQMVSGTDMSWLVSTSDVSINTFLRSTVTQW